MVITKTSAVGLIGTYEGRETVILNSKEVRTQEGFEKLLQLKVAQPVEYDDEDDARILPT